MMVEEDCCGLTSTRKTWDCSRNVVLFCAFGLVMNLRTGQDVVWQGRMSRRDFLWTVIVIIWTSRGRNGHAERCYSWKTSWMNHVRWAVQERERQRDLQDDLKSYRCNVIYLNWTIKSEERVCCPSRSSWIPAFPRGPPPKSKECERKKIHNYMERR